MTASSRRPKPAFGDDSTLAMLKETLKDLPHVKIPANDGKREHKSPDSAQSSPTAKPSEKHKTKKASSKKGKSAKQEMDVDADGACAPEPISSTRDVNEELKHFVNGILLTQTVKETHSQLQGAYEKKHTVEKTLLRFFDYKKPHLPPEQRVDVKEKTEFVKLGAKKSSKKS